MERHFWEFNQKGTTHVKRQQYREAVASFSRGLGLVKSSIVNVDPVGSLCIDCCSTDSPKESEFALEQQCTPDVTNPLLHQTPLQIPISLRRCACTTCRSKVSFVFIFNMALSYHLRVFIHGKSSRSLVKALSLYEMAESLCHSGGFPIAPLELAILQKNMTHVVWLQEFRNRSHSPIHLLASTVPNMDERDAEKIWNGFLSLLLNLCVFQGDHTAPAA